MNKVEITNELLARIYGAYIFSQYKIEDEYGQYTDTVTPSLLQAIFCGAARNGKLLLTPLSEITDEDAIEVAKCGQFSPNEIDNETLAQIGREIALECEENIPTHELSGEMWQSIWDLLRSKGYDTGFAHIPSLIEAGIAIAKSEKLTQ